MPPVMWITQGDFPGTAWVSRTIDLPVARALGPEGIVSKRRDALYRSGRTGDWTKVKNPDAPAATRVMD